jgi:hypothetical protein
MGSHPTLDHTERAAEARPLNPDHWSHRQAAAHPQVGAWPNDNPDLTQDLDHRDRIDDHAYPSHERAAEQAFDRVNPTSASPPTAPTASATATSPSARPPWR